MLSKTNDFIARFEPLIRFGFRIAIVAVLALCALYLQSIDRQVPTAGQVEEIKNRTEKMSDQINSLHHAINTVNMTLVLSRPPFR